jgi:hypothetical protein
LPKHDIKEVENVGIKEIPLAYIDTHDDVYHANVNVEKQFVKSQSKKIRPYDEFEDPDMYFYDSNNKLVTNVALKRLGNRYVYEPTSITEFTPETFSCDITIQRNMSYSNDNDIDLSVCVVEQSNVLELSGDLISICGDAPKRGICPSHITVNGGSMSPYSFTASDYKTCDFMFIDSFDGKHIRSENNEELIDIDTILNEHVNVWLSVSSFGDMLRKCDDSFKSLTIASPMLYQNKEYLSSKPDKMSIFDRSKTFEAYSKKDYEYEFLCDAVLILHKAGCGFVIVSPRAFFDDINQYAGIVYEAMMNVYCRGYYKASSPKTWITDYPIDSIAYQTAPLNKNHGRLNINDILVSNGIKGKTAFRIVSIKCSSNNILFNGIDSSGNMSFKKLITNTDPVKKEGQVSYYTTKQTVIYYMQEDINLIEVPFDVKYRADGSTVYIIINPYHSSASKINSDDQQELKIPNNNGVYFICTKPSKPDLSNVYSLVLDSEYQPDVHGYKMATVNIVTTPQTKLYDIRIMGGGLPKVLPDDYNMIDIGNINGRPYRVGSTSIIRLPKKYEPYKEKILDAINMHAASGDYPLLVFEKE